MARAFAIDEHRESFLVDMMGERVDWEQIEATRAEHNAPMFVEMSQPLVARPGRPTVLLVHGASASSNTFKDQDGGLLKYLQDLDTNVYTVDWRSSMRTVDRLIPPDPFFPIPRSSISMPRSTTSTQP
jgi:pimeloyl-ACP methyl ester carboxylesterase